MLLPGTAPPPPRLRHESIVIRFSSGVRRWSACTTTTSILTGHPLTPSTMFASTSSLSPAQLGQGPYMCAIIRTQIAPLTLDQYAYSWAKWISRNADKPDRGVHGPCGPCSGLVPVRVGTHYLRVYYGAWSGRSEISGCCCSWILL